MYVKAKTLDDLLRQVLKLLIMSTNRIKPSRGEATEMPLPGVLLHITNPLARLSRTETKGTLFSCLGELLWYLAKTDDLEFIKYYVPKYEDNSEDKETIYGAYGPRLFGIGGKHQVITTDQISNVVTLLQENPESRRAVVQLFDATDISRSEDSKRRIEIPCTCTFQFMIRRRRLHMITNMRSNDAFLGLPHDVFAFTMIQEMIARMLGVNVGTYKHAVGSLHLYDEHREKAQQYLDEGYQSTITAPMPEMPKGDPRPSIAVVLEAEFMIRNGHEFVFSDEDLDPYWADLIRLLIIFSKKENETDIIQIKNEMAFDIYRIYIEKRQTIMPTQKKKAEQLSLIQE